MAYTEIFSKWICNIDIICSHIQSYLLI